MVRTRSGESSSPKRSKIYLSDDDISIESSENLFESESESESRLPLQDFDLDYTQFSKDMIRSLVLELGDEYADKIQDTVKKVISHVDKLYLPLMGITPRSNIIGAPSEQVEQLESELKAIRLEIDESSPSLYRILNSNMTRKQKREMIELYDIYTNTESYSEHWLALRREIDAHIKESEKEKLSLEQKEECECIRDHLDNQIVTESLEYCILTANVSDANRRVLYDMYTDMKELTPTSEEYASRRSNIKTALKSATEHKVELPVKHTSDRRDICQFISHVRRVLDDEIESLDYVKQALIEEVAVMISNPHAKHKGIALCGSPGLGKTAVSMALGKAVGLPYYKISMGGITSKEALRGGDSIFMNSTHGKIVEALRTMQCRNGIIFFDEFNRLHENGNSRVQDALLDIVDPTQNDVFEDAQLPGIKHDLSEILFIYSMNEPPTDPALRDRLNIIRVHPYTFNEKCLIIKNKLIPRALQNVGMTECILIFPDRVIEYIVGLDSSHEHGVRQVQSKIQNLIKKLNYMHLSGDHDKHIVFPLIVTEGIVERLLRTNERRDFMTMYT
jgi:ATP-dependent Lon protease